MLIVERCQHRDGDAHPVGVVQSMLCTTGAAQDPGIKEASMISATELRGNLYKFLDQVLETGRPLEIRRNGQVLKITAESVKPKANKLLNLKKRHGVIACTHEELIAGS